MWLVLCVGLPWPARFVVNFTEPYLRRRVLMGISVAVVNTEALESRLDQMEKLLTFLVDDRAKPVPRVFTVAETATVLGLSEKTVRKLVADGLLARLSNVGSRCLILRSSVDSFIEENTVNG